MRNLLKSNCSVIASTIGASVLLTSCAHVWKIPITPLVYPAGEKVQANVQLLISDEFKRASWRAMISPMDIGEIPIGDELVKESEKLARTVFAEVTVVYGGLASQTVAADAALIPK